MDEIEWYQNSSLESIKNIIKDNINTASRSFVAIGYYLKNVRDRELYLEDGYKSIWEFAQSEFGISKSWSCKWMQINDKFSVNGNSPILLDNYKDFSSSKLADMVNMSDEQLIQIRPGMTVKAIRTLKNNRINYTEHDIEKELNRRATKFEVLQKDDYIEDLRKRAQIKLDAVSLLRDAVLERKEPCYCPHCHKLIDEPESVIEPDESEIVLVQPELPILKNNEQRKGFIDNYTSWPVWIDTELTGERYYRYDFENSTNFVIRVSTCHKWNGTGGYEKEIIYGHEKYYIVGVENKEKYKPKNPTFSESETNKSAMIDYLKEIQKKG